MKVYSCASRSLIGSCFSVKRRRVKRSPPGMPRSLLTPARRHEAALRGRAVRWRVRALAAPAAIHLVLVYPPALLGRPLTLLTHAPLGRSVRLASLQVASAEPWCVPQASLGLCRSWQVATTRYRRNYVQGAQLQVLTPMHRTAALALGWDGPLPLASHCGVKEGPCSSCKSVGR